MLLIPKNKADCEVDIKVWEKVLADAIGNKDRFQSLYESTNRAGFLERVKEEERNIEIANERLNYLENLLKNL